MDNVAEVLAQIVNARWEGGRKQEHASEELFERLEKLLSG